MARAVPDNALPLHVAETAQMTKENVMAQVFVTGGSGFIGQVLVRRLTSEGHTVRALVRSENSAAAVDALGAVPVRGDLTEPDGWREGLAGSEVIFHLAAETDITAERERHDAVTVRGTRAVVEAARQANVSRFIHCGSEAALLAGDPLIEVDESEPLRPDSEAAYCAAKAAAEKIVLDASGPGFDTLAIRPRFVWGPGSILIESLVAAARAGQFAWIDGGRHITDVTYVDNAVEGLMRGWQHGRPANAYFVTDQHRVVLREFLRPLFDAYGVGVPVPEMDAQTAAREVPVPARWFLGQPCTLRADKATAQLGYRPLVSHTDGLDAVAKSLAGNGA
ncbi:MULTISPECIES: NAD-dependent epimerase/dehydratase family protein [unclassified Streptomyces]|uniref:NAD-dependent epimerase/dehydratase family protein n=1 Tax=unclassified Streptomyces TaxID=2593676 RepID=UPI002E14B924|nr:NAD-dependent epimerase/dehydratase family protein [Streptomyces sp. NBC_01197]WSS52219.1 NAD-dependent epimerase/dehydratase family protein [Streptomyces sp. NBC_01180]